MLCLFALHHIMITFAHIRELLKLLNVMFQSLSLVSFQVSLGVWIHMRLQQSPIITAHQTFINYIFHLNLGMITLISCQNMQFAYSCILVLILSFSSLQYLKFVATIVLFFFCSTHKRF